MDSKTLKIIQERERREAEAEAAPPLTAIQIARLQWQVAQLLQSGETVAAALRRLSGRKSRNARHVKRPKNKITNGEFDESDHGDTELFDRLTEAASGLVDAGESDVYSRKREYFKHAAAVYIDVDDEGGGGDVGPSNIDVAALRPSTMAYEDADEDMFAEDGENERKEEGKHISRSGDDGGYKLGGATLSQQSAAATIGHKEDFEDWPMRELRQYLKDRGVVSAAL